ncbi:glycosyltransferase family 4 protein [Burkholderia ubonensis]|uniref:glycosyltransferase family 4 protein n=1 Tax=Burkholderia ubonensis TaxID=101571 RepID=UPI0007546CE8|nr:glycosyltransferase family 4 protein [Burkholderia ubonensis]KVD57848.1 hypothetical protein WI87_16260 [Burkholderia ubonensis]KVM68202.1 hypothetical protein WJ61_24670 [Burkholderia ubonensis]KVN43571.1 hypothetical protein WJ64_30130 [Burkholderia ubonensis]KVQ05614.1 hypothetical protein WJ98_07900 [Burkholderia ubonensis]KWB63504.1 hypothetical protein WL39_15610 [Burkholderia ubonensis]
MRLMICAPDIFSGDAVGNHCLGLARAAERLEFPVEIYAQRYDADSGVRHIDELFERIRDDDQLLVSYSIFDPYLTRLLNLRCRKIVYFHGVTPPELLREFEPVTADLCAASIDQFADLAGFDTIVANSAFTAASLTPYVGTRELRDIPPVFADMPAFDDRTRVQAEPTGAARILVVGRVVPHKRVEDAIEIVGALRTQGIDASLTVVGSATNAPYLEHLIRHAEACGLAYRFDVTGVISNDALFEHFHRASALVSVSAHEGFGVPVLEAMHMGVCCFARSGTAASDICVPSATLPADNLNAAELIGGVLRDDEARRELISLGLARASAWLRKTSDSAWREVLTPTFTH